VNPAESAFKDLGFARLGAHVAMFNNSVDHAEDQLRLGRLQPVVQDLELALTNLHEIVDEIQPPEEDLGMHD